MNFEMCNVAGVFVMHPHTGYDYKVVLKDGRCFKRKGSYWEIKKKFNQYLAGVK